MIPPLTRLLEHPLLYLITCAHVSTVQNSGTNCVFMLVQSDRKSLSVEWKFRFLVRTDSATLRIASLIRPASSGADSRTGSFWLILREQEGRGAVFGYSGTPRLPFSKKIDSGASCASSGPISGSGMPDRACEARKTLTEAYRRFYAP